MATAAPDFTFLDRLIQGQVGATGPVGPAGPAGTYTGIPCGFSGFVTGPPGRTGATGPQGAQGSPGMTGATGPRGFTGIAGTTGPTGPRGNTGAQGPAGTGLGVTGPAGAAGATGSIGPTGQRGASGTPGGAGPVTPNSSASLVGAFVHTLVAQVYSLADQSVVFIGSRTVGRARSGGGLLVKESSAAFSRASGGNATLLSSFVVDGVNAADETASSQNWGSDLVPTGPNVVALVSGGATGATLHWSVNLWTDPVSFP